MIIKAIENNGKRTAHINLDAVSSIVINEESDNARYAFYCNGIIDSFKAQTKFQWLEQGDDDCTNKWVNVDLDHIISIWAQQEEE